MWEADYKMHIEWMKGFAGVAALIAVFCGCGTAAKPASVIPHDPTPEPTAVVTIAPTMIAEERSIATPEPEEPLPTETPDEPEAKETNAPKPSAIPKTDESKEKEKTETEEDGVWTPLA